MLGDNGQNAMPRGADDLRRSPVAWAKFFGFCAAIVIGPGLLLSALLRPAESGNPRRNLSPVEEARQADARAEAREYRRQQRYWLTRIETGEATFGEAACVLDRGGEWDSSKELCSGEERHLHP